jgi:predicted porin
VDQGDAKQIAIGYTYPLSKRTSFNANIARVSGDATFFGTVAGQINAANVTARGTMAERTGYEIGIRHTF